MVRNVTIGVSLYLKDHQQAYYINEFVDILFNFILVTVTCKENVVGPTTFSDDTS